MSSDYKYDAQLRAEEIAEEEFGTDFYSLSREKQDEVYGRGLRDRMESMYEAADFLRDAEKEGFR